jgi:hypothetical protein
LSAVESHDKGNTLASLRKSHIAPGQVGGTVGVRVIDGYQLQIRLCQAPLGLKLRERVCKKCA